MAMIQERASFFRKVFLALGWLGVVVGIGIGLYSWFGLRPRLVSLSEQAQSNLATLNETAQRIGSLQGGAKVAHLLPETLKGLQGTLHALSGALSGTAQATQETKSGVAGVVLPKESLGIDIALLHKSADQMGRLARNVGQIRMATDASAKDLHDLSKVIERIGPGIGSLQHSIGDATLPTQACLLGTAFSGIYIFMGIFSLVFSATLKKAVALTVVRSNEDEMRKVS